MPTRARVFMNNRSQHLTIPREFRFKSSEVSMRRDAATGDIIITEIPNIDEVFAALDAAGIPSSFLLDREKAPAEDRQSLEDWTK